MRQNYFVQISRSVDSWTAIYAFGRAVSTLSQAQLAYPVNGKPLVG